MVCAYGIEPICHGGAPLPTDLTVDDLYMIRWQPNELAVSLDVPWAKDPTIRIPITVA